MAEAIRSFPMDSELEGFEGNLEGLELEGYRGKFKGKFEELGVDLEENLKGTLEGTLEKSFEGLKGLEGLEESTKVQASLGDDFEGDEFVMDQEDQEEEEEERVGGHIVVSDVPVDKVLVRKGRNVNQEVRGGG